MFIPRNSKEISGDIMLLSHLCLISRIFHKFRKIFERKYYKIQAFSSLVKKWAWSKIVITSEQIKNVNFSKNVTSNTVQRKSIEKSSWIFNKCSEKYVLKMILDPISIQVHHASYHNVIVLTFCLVSTFFSWNISKSA